MDIAAGKILRIGISDEGSEGTGHRGLAVYCIEGGGSGTHSIGAGSEGRIYTMAEGSD